MTCVIIIGVGFCGLVAAAEHASAGLDVTILEAHNSPVGVPAHFFGFSVPAVSFCGIRVAIEVLADR